MLQNAYLLAKIGADTAENEQHSAKILPTDALRRRGRRAPLPHGAAREAAADRQRRREHGRPLRWH